MSTAPVAPQTPLRRRLTRISEAFAALGGLLIVAAVLVTVASVIMARFGRPILGDTEIVELLSGIAIAAFLPYCQVRGGNVVIDFFTAWLPAPARARLDAVANLLVAGVVAVLAWRLIQGGIDNFERGRESMFLNLPQWWGYAGAGLACTLWVATCLVSAWDGLSQARRGSAPPSPATDARASR